jgi:hypothetical protein
VVHVSAAAKAASTEAEQVVTSFSRERAQALWQAARSYILLRVKVDEELNHLDGRTKVVRVTMVARRGRHAEIGEEIKSILFFQVSDGG